MSMDWLAMLQFAIGATTVLGVGVWLLYFTVIRPAITRQNLQSLGETSMSTPEEAQMLTAFRVLPKERKLIAIKLIEALI
ncbi:MAG: hypothetical protein ACYC39_09360 [Thiobacillus sp.]